MKNMSSFTTYSDVPVMVELTDEDLTTVTAGNGFNDANDGHHHNGGNHHNDRRHRDNRHNRNDHRHRDNRH